MNRRIKKFLIINLYLIALFPLFPRIYGSISIITFFCLSLLNFFRCKKKINKKQTKIFLLLSSLFFIYLITSFYSSNFNQSLKLIKLSLPIMIFPASFILLKAVNIEEKIEEKIKICFISALLLSTILINFKLGVYNGDPLSLWDYRNEFEDYRKIHGTYYSIWLGFANLIIIDLFLKYKFFKNKFLALLLFLIILYFLYWQFLLQARLPLFLTLTLFCFLFFTNLENKKHKIFFLSIIILSLTYIFFNYNNLVTKHLKFSLPEGNYETNFKNINSEDIRYGIYYCSFNVMVNNIYLGTGVGDVNDDLNKCYKGEILSDVYQIQNYNTHNQYLQVLLSGGIMALIYFLLNIYFLVTNAIKNKHRLYFIFLIFVTFSLLTENVLNRHDGIIFFSFFSIVFYNLKSNK